MMKVIRKSCNCETYGSWIRQRIGIMKCCFFVGEGGGGVGGEKTGEHKEEPVCQNRCVRNLAK